MQPKPLPRGSPLRRALESIADRFPDIAEEVIRRRLIALIAESGLTVTSAAEHIGMAHGLLARKLAGPGTAPSNRRPLDDETIDRIVTSIGCGPDRIAEIRHDHEDVEVLHWLADAARESGASRYIVARLRLPTVDAVAKWPDAPARIDRLAALGFVTVDGDGMIAFTPAGRTCAAR